MADNLTQPLLIVNTKAQVAGQITPAMSQSSTASYAASQTLNQTLVLRAGQQYAPNIGFSSLSLNTTGPVHILAAVGSNPAAINQIVNQQSTFDTIVDSFTITNNGTASVTVKLIIVVAPNTATTPVGVVTSLNGMIANINIVSGPGISVTSGSQAVTITNTGVFQVNGQSGNVSISASNLPGISRVGQTGQYGDLLGIPTPYSLPVATTSILGGVKQGSNVTISVDGTLSVAAPYVLPAATVSALGGVKQGANVTIATDGTISVVAPYVLPTASTTVLGGVKQGGNTVIAPDGTLTAITPIASATVLGGVKQGANVTIAGDGTLSVGAPYALPVASTTILGGVKQGAGVTIGVDGTITTNVLTVAGRLGNVVLAASDVSGLATIATSGSYGDLSNVPATFKPPVATTTVLGGVTQGAGVAIDANGVLAANVLTVVGRTGNVTLAVSDVTGAASSAVLAAGGGAALVGTSEGPTVQQSLDTLSTKLTNALVNTSVVTTSLNQTVYPIPGGYPINLIDVYAMGVHLDPSDFAATDGSNVVVSAAVAAKMPINAKLLVRSIGSFNVANAATLAQLGATNGATLIGYGSSTVSQALDAINNGTATNAGALLATDKVLLSRGAGLLETTRATEIQFSLAAYAGYTNGTVVGAAARPVNDKLSEIPSVRDVGLVADGVTSEGAALVAAFASNKWLKIPVGQTVYVNSVVNLPDNVTLVGPGKISLGAGGVVTLGNGTVVSCVAVDGANANASDGFQIRAGTVGGQLLYPKITNVTGNGVYILDGATAALVYKPYMSNIGPVGGVNSAITGCGVCVQNAEADIIGGYIEKTWGQGGVSIYGTTRTNVEEVTIRYTFYRAIQTHAYSPQVLTGVTIVRNNLQFTGSINATGSAVGCNGIFAVGNVNASDVLIQDNYVANNGENNIEAPTAIIVGNTCLNSNFYGGTTPSTDGIWFGPGSIVSDNAVFNSKGCGLKCYQTVQIKNLTVTRNRVYSPGSTGYSIQADQATASFLDCVMADNEFYDYNSANSALNSFAIIASNGATLTNFTVNGNKTFGVRTSNVLSAGTVEYHNSWDTNHSLTLTDGLNYMTTQANSSAGGFIRNMLSYGVNYSLAAGNYVLNTTTNAGTVIANGNNLIGFYVVPSGTANPISAAQLSTFLTACVTPTGFQVVGSTWSDNRLFQIGPYYFWIDAAGHLRYLNGKPGADAVGHTVGAGSTLPDIGDRSYTTFAATRNTIIFNTPLTQARSVSLSASGNTDGDKVRVVRTANATGAFNLTVAATTSKVLTPGQWCDVEYWGNGGGVWIITASGSL